MPVSSLQAGEHSTKVALTAGFQEGPEPELFYNAVVYVNTHFPQETRILVYSR